MSSTIQISDGTITVALNDLVSYRLQNEGWYPKIAKRRKNTLGDSVLYEDVLEELTIDVLGPTTSGVLYNLQRLSTLLDNVQRWYAGENVSGVRITYGADGATSVHTSMLLDTEDNTSFIELSPKFNRLTDLHEIWGVNLSLLRRGQWLSTTVSGASTSTNNAEIITATLAGSVPVIPSPVLVSVTGYVHTNTDGLVIITDDDSKLAIVNAKDLTAGGGTISNVSDTTNKSRSGTIRRYGASTSAGLNSYAFTSGFYNVAKHIDVYATIRVNHAVTFTLAPWIQFYAGGNVYLKTTTLTYTDGLPHVVYLGTAKNRNRPDVFNFNFSASVTDSTKTFDIDYILFVGVDDDKTTTVSVNGMNAAAPQILSLDHNLLTLPNPDVHTDSAGVRTYNSYNGNPLVMNASGEVAAFLLMTYSNFWRGVDPSNSNALLTHVLTAQRTAANLIPV